MYFFFFFRKFYSPSSLLNPPQRGSWAKGSLRKETKGCFLGRPEERRSVVGSMPGWQQEGGSAGGVHEQGRSCGTLHPFSLPLFFPFSSLVLSLLSSSSSSSYYYSCSPLQLCEGWHDSLAVSLVNRYFVSERREISH